MYERAPGRQIRGSVSHSGSPLRPCGVLEDSHEVVHESDLAWTIVRPSGLFETSEVSPYEVKSRSRADLAESIRRKK